MPQGKFLFHLPFPTADFLSVKEIMKIAGVDDANNPEIIDILNVMIEFGVVESL
jgi:hypothetical protein